VEASESLRRGTLLLAEVERLMQTVGQTHFLKILEPPRIVPVDTDTHVVGPNTMETTPPEGIISKVDPSSL
jgi:hypothetical protein